MYKSKKKINYDHVYMLVITAIALVFIIAFKYENYCKNEMISSYERELKVQENTYQDLQNQLEILTDEYNDLLEGSK